MKFCWWWIDLDHLWLTPATRCTLPPAWVSLGRLLVGDRPVTADLHSITVMALVKRHKLDPAVAVPIVVLIVKRYHPLTSGLLACEWAAWVVRPVLTVPRNFVYAVLNQDLE
jgi:hypothetical protein